MRGMEQRRRALSNHLPHASHCRLPACRVLSSPLFCPPLSCRPPFSGSFCCPQSPAFPLFLSCRARPPLVWPISSVSLSV